MTNDRICPEDLLRVLLPADKIPDGAVVTKRTGEQHLVLRRSLKIYHDSGKSNVPAVIEGLFLISPRGHINQVTPGKILAWVVSAEDLVRDLSASWETEQK